MHGIKKGDNYWKYKYTFTDAVKGIAEIELTVLQKQSTTVLHISFVVNGTTFSSMRVRVNDKTTMFFREAAKKSFF